MIIDIAETNFRLQQEVQESHQQILVLFPAKYILEAPIYKRVDRASPHKSIRVFHFLVVLWFRPAIPSTGSCRQHIRYENIRPGHAGEINQLFQPERKQPQPADLRFLVEHFAILQGLSHLHSLPLLRTANRHFCEEKLHFFETLITFAKR